MWPAAWYVQLNHLLDSLWTELSACEPVQVVKAANDNPYGLASGVLAKDQGIIDSLVRKIRAGTVWVNTYNVYDAGEDWPADRQAGRLHSVLCFKLLATVKQPQHVHTIQSVVAAFPMQKVPQDCGPTPVELPQP